MSLKEFMKGSRDPAVIDAARNEAKTTRLAEIERELERLTVRWQEEQALIQKLRNRRDELLLEKQELLGE